MWRPFVLLSTVLFFTHAALAGVLLDVDASVFQDSLVTDETSTATRSLYGGGVYVPVDNKERFYLGATFLASSASDTTAAGDTTFSNQDIILGFKWFIDKRRTFTLSAGYGVVSKAAYEAPSLTEVETWTGTSTFAKFTVAPEINRYWNAGLSVLYYQGAFVEKKVSDTVSTVSNSKSVVIPSIAVTFRW